MFIVLTAIHLHFAVRPGIGKMFARPLAAWSTSGIESFSTEGFASAQALQPAQAITAPCPIAHAILHLRPLRGFAA
jgi:hypothetical protein